MLHQDADLDGISRFVLGPYWRIASVEQRPEFEGLVVGAMSWITGLVEADVKPNIKQVTPEADPKQFAGK